MRLINADELLTAFPIGDEPTVTIACIRATIKHMPTIEEHKVGRWTSENACEFCGFQPWFERDIHTLSFCPNCGADMRGGGQDE